MTNDNHFAMDGMSCPLPDAHGQAALLLVESLIHARCKNATLSAGDAIELTERAISVQYDQPQAADGAAAPMWRSHTLLSSIATSLRADVNGRPPSSRQVL